ncbi:hypothetical protein ACFL5A_03770 [Gemmatimonadota bacterium]
MSRLTRKLPALLIASLVVVGLSSCCETCKNPTGATNSPDIAGNWQATTEHGLLRVTIEPYFDPSDLDGSCVMGVNVDGGVDGSIAEGQVSLQLYGWFGSVTFTGNATESSMVGVLNGSWSDFPNPPAWEYEFVESPATFSGNRHQIPRPQIRLLSPVRP